MELFLLLLTCDSVFSGFGRYAVDFAYTAPLFDRYLVYFLISGYHFLISMIFWVVLPKRLFVFAAIPLITDILSTKMTKQKAVTEKALGSVKNYLLSLVIVYGINQYGVRYFRLKEIVPSSFISKVESSDLEKMYDFLFHLAITTVIRAGNNASKIKKMFLSGVSYLYKSYYNGVSVPYSRKPAGKAALFLIFRELRWKELSNPDILEELAMDEMIIELFSALGNTLADLSQRISFSYTLISLPYGPWCIILINIYSRPLFFGLLKTLLVLLLTHYLDFFSLLDLFFLISGIEMIELITSPFVRWLLDCIFSLLWERFSLMIEKCRQVGVTNNAAIIAMSIIPYGYGNLPPALLLLPGNDWRCRVLVIICGWISSYHVLHLIFLVLCAWMDAYLSTYIAPMTVLEQYF